MITFTLSLVVLIFGYIFYGRYVERVFGPDDRTTTRTTISSSSLLTAKTEEQIADMIMLYIG